jgi:hypothetical protein
MIIMPSSMKSLATLSAHWRYGAGVQQRRLTTASQPYRLINALSKQQGGRGVPGIMNAHPADSGGFEQSIPFVPVGVGADRPPVGLAPDEVAVVPGWPCGHAFLELGGSVRFECRHEL